MFHSTSHASVKKILKISASYIVLPVKLATPGAGYPVDPFTSILDHTVNTGALHASKEVQTRAAVVEELLFRLLCAGLGAVTGAAAAGYAAAAAAGSEAGRLQQCEAATASHVSSGGRAGYGHMHN